MAKVTVNLQDSFLNQIRKEGSEVKIVLTDGSSLTGVVRGFDNFTVIINSKDSQHLIYKHAISQLITKRDARRVQKPRAEEARRNDRKVLTLLISPRLRWVKLNRLFNATVTSFSQPPDQSAIYEDMTPNGPANFYHVGGISN